MKIVSSGIFLVEKRQICWAEWRKPRRRCRRGSDMLSMGVGRSRLYGGLCNSSRHLPASSPICRMVVTTLGSGRRPNSSRKVLRLWRLPLLPDYTLLRFPPRVMSGTIVGCSPCGGIICVIMYRRKSGNSVESVDVKGSRLRCTRLRSTGRMDVFWLRQWRHPRTQGRKGLEHAGLAGNFLA